MSRKNITSLNFSHVPTLCYAHYTENTRIKAIKPSLENVAKVPARVNMYTPFNLGSAEGNPQYTKRKGKSVVIRNS